MSKQVKYDPLFSAIDTLSEEYISFLEEVCRIESPTAYKPGVDAVGSFFADKARQKGWKVEIREQEVSGNVFFITLNPDAPGKPISLSAHMDTVHPVGSFGYPAVRREGDKLYGPGTTDCKGGGAVALLAMDALERIGYKERPIQLLLQSDEEVSSRFSNKATINSICEKAKDSVAFFNLEGSRNGAVCIQRKGITRYVITVHGQAAHASTCADSGANAIIEAAHKMIKIDKYKEAEGITCSCGTISGGTVSNTVPDKCTFEVDVRFADYEQRERIDRILRDIVKESTVPGCTAEIEVLSSRACMPLVERNTELLKKVNGIFRDAGFEELKPIFRGGGSDAAEVTEYGIPCLDSLGIDGDGVHELSEYAIISSLAGMAKRIAAIIYSFNE